MKHWLEKEADKVNWRRVWLAVLIGYVVILFGGTALASYLIGG